MTRAQRRSENPSERSASEPRIRTEVILTGTGVPHHRPGTAGAGTLVRRGDVALQLDAGRLHVVLTHLIPPPDRPGDREAFADDLREGGYAGRITVGEDLTTVVLGDEA